MSTPTLPLPDAPDISGKKNFKLIVKVPDTSLEGYKLKDGTPYDSTLTASDYKANAVTARIAGFNSFQSAEWKTYYKRLSTAEPELAAQLFGTGYRNMVAQIAKWDACGDGGEKPDRNWNAVSITVNPREGTGILQLHTLIDKCLEKNWIPHDAQWLYAIEQRSTEPPARGIHCHIYLPRPIDPGSGLFTKSLSAVTREVRSTFTKLVDNARAVVVKPIRVGDESRVRNYMKGNKKDPEKMKKVMFDREWRKTVDLEDYYENENSIEVDLPESDEEKDQEEDDDEGPDSDSESVNDEDNL